MKNTKLGEFEEIILLLVGILAEEAYALRLAEAYKKQTKRSTSVGAVHSTLSRLSEKGLLQSDWGEPTSNRGGRRKRIYQITAYGKNILQESKDLRMDLWKQYPGFSI